MEETLLKRNQIAINKAYQLFERLNSAWIKIEDTIRNKGILAPVEFKYKTCNKKEYWIGVQKISFNWKICYAVTENWSKKNWLIVTDTPLEVRLELLSQIHGLFEQILLVNERGCNSLESEVQKAEAISSQFLEDT